MKNRSITASGQLFTCPYQGLHQQEIDFEAASNAWDVEVAAQKKQEKMVY